jgi:tartrate-resistant acid phosphatase type 5
MVLVLLLRSSRRMRSFSLAIALFATSIVHLPSHGHVVRLIVTGDAGGTHSQLRGGIPALEKRTPIDGIVLVGDNFYPCGVTSLADPQWSKITDHFGPAGVPIFAILGNHDYGDPQPTAGPPTIVCGHPSPQAEVDASGRIAHWVFPARHYVLRNEFAELAMIDSQPIASAWMTGFLGSDAASDEVHWLTAQLETARVPWRVVVGHHTMYSSGEHGRRNGKNQRNMRALLPLLEREHVDLYICGHDHDMELIGHLKAGREPLFLISGAGSGLDEMKPRGDGSEPPTIWPPTPHKPFLGFALLEITRSKLAVTFYDDAGHVRSSRYVLRK